LISTVGVLTQNADDDYETGKALIAGARPTPVSMHRDAAGRSLPV
jgi:hypothetical protein